ncbi:MAG: hypothetical protein DRJ50_10480, partial [Actinobacteria bacterium]
MVADLVGRTLEHYSVLEHIGSGGMGEVNVAEDTRLERQVALKVLPPELAGDPKRLGRFDREAKALAALNHPPIVIIYSVEKADDIHFLTMELVRGTILRQRMDRFMIGNLVDFDPAKDRIELTNDDRTSLDCWARAQLADLIQKVHHGYETYQFKRVVEAIFEFCNDTMSS